MDQTPASRFVDVLSRLGYKTQQQIADLLNIARPTAGTIVRQEREPSFSDVARLKAEHDEVNIDWIFTGKGQATTRTLAPVPKEALALAEVTTTDGPTSGPATVAEAENILLREQLEEKDKLIEEKDHRLADKETIIDMLKATVEELRGKPLDSSDAADDSDEAPKDPNAPTFSGGAAPKPMLRKRVGFAPSYVTE